MKSDRHWSKQSPRKKSVYLGTLVTLSPETSTMQRTPAKGGLPFFFYFLLFFFLRLDFNKFDETGSLSRSVMSVSHWLAATGLARSC